MTLLSLNEFQQITGLSDRAIVSLLSQNRLPCQLDPSKGLMLDIDACEVKDLVSAVATRQMELLPNRRKILIERFASIVGENLEQITEEALSIVLADSQ